MTERDTSIGHIVRLGGGIADIRFTGTLPAISTRLVTLTDPEIVIEVASLPAETIARGLVMNPTSDLRIGLAVRDTGGPIEVPVGEAVLGRMFNLFGETIDGGPPLGEMRHRPILRAPVPLAVGCESLLSSTIAEEIRDLRSRARIVPSYACASSPASSSI
jgi:F-type H+/Na+-transporting ATPase subunit beta